MMKKYIIYITTILLIALISGCTDESLYTKNGASGEVQFRLFVTTPQAETNSLSTRGSHSGALSGEEAIKSLSVLVFESDATDAKLLEIALVTISGSSAPNMVTLTARNNAHLRLVANYVIPHGLVNKTWSEIQASPIYNVDNSVNQVFPMTGEVPNFNIKYQHTIGTLSTPIKLTRALAKITINVSGTTDFTYTGNKVFQIMNQGYLFDQGATLPTPSGSTVYNESVDYNKNTVTYSPERKNTGANNQTPLDNRTYIIIKGQYKGIESYYRVDFGSLNSNQKMVYVDFKRNINYLLSVKIKGYGYANENLAKAAPINANIVEVSIIESSAYEFLVDEFGQYLGVSNSETHIYSKAKYYVNGFSDSQATYNYVLTTITNEKTEGWNPTDIQIVSSQLANASIKVVDKYDDEGNPIDGMKEYLLVATIDDLSVNAKASIRIRYGRLVKEIQVYRKPYIDCHYGNISLGLSNSGKVSKSRKDDGSFNTEGIQWIMLSENMGNCASTAVGDPNNQMLNANGNVVYAQFKEYIDGEKMGKYAKTKAQLEGFRFADVYTSSVNENYRRKHIFAQANADLSGFFGMII